MENRKQFVEIDGYTSETRMVETGVPQGSLLAVILFQCFIDSLPCTLRYCQSILYADDTTIFLMGKSLKFLRTKVQKDLDNVCGWLNAHELKLNVAKSKVMLLNAKGLCPNVELIMNNEILEVVEKFKFLGVTVDVTLNFDEHYGLLHNKLVKSVFIIRTLAKTLPRSCLHSLYFAFYHLNLMYCATTWFPLLKATSQNSLYMLQKRLIRTLSNASFRQHCMHLYKRNNILILNDQVYVDNVKLAHRVKNKSCPIAIQYLFHSHNLYNTRNRNTAIPIHKSSKLNKSFLCRPLIEWSKLQADVKNQKNLKSFRKKVKKLLIDKY